MRLGISALVSLTTFAVAMLCATLPHAARAAAPKASAPLRLTGSTALPGYKGDFDHFAADVAGGRLFLAGEDGATLEVFDLGSGKHLRTIKGFDQPHAILYLPDVNRLIVTDSGAGMTRIVDGKSYRMIGSIPLTAGADSMRYDPSRRHMYVVTGGKNAEPKMTRTVVSEVDPRTGSHIGDVTFDTDFTEAMAAEQHGHRLFVNVTGKSTLAVVDKATRHAIANWPIHGAELNASMAFDEKHQRLFIGTRKPFKLLVLDAANGNMIASFDAPQRTNEVIFDEANQRIYMAGDDYLGVIQQKDPHRYEELAHMPTDMGAKTAILVPARKCLYIAVSPGDSGTGGKLLRFDVLPGASVKTVAGK
ncbi:YncE family protein [Paraburkholderia sp. SIMBA_030]|uniref:YncE family protein n=1 Tax=Paraburkholderia sp. SIMBA_030 TaxID=3085773 RepID=UPI0039784A17